MGGPRQEEQQSSPSQTIPRAAGQALIYSTTCQTSHQLLPKPNHTKDSRAGANFFKYLPNYSSAATQPNHNKDNSAGANFFIYTCQTIHQLLPKPTHTKDRSAGANFFNSTCQTIHQLLPNHTKDSRAGANFFNSTCHTFHQLLPKPIHTKDSRGVIKFFSLFAKPYQGHEGR